MKILDCTIEDLQTGKVSLLDPDQQYAYEERAGIMQHDAGIPRQQAEQFSWCRHACMLTAGQAAGMMSDGSDRCKVKTPCPRFTGREGNA